MRFLLLLLSFNLMAWSESDISSKMMMDRIDRMINRIEQTYAGESVRWRAIVGSTPITGETPGASDRPSWDGKHTSGGVSPTSTSESLDAGYGGINSVVEPVRTNDRDECSIHSCRRKGLAVSPFVRRACVQKTVMALAVEPRYQIVSQSTATFLHHRKQRAPCDRGVNPSNSRGLDIYRIMAQIAVESSWNHAAVSDEGCIGLMQIHPLTARDYGIPEWTLTHPVLGIDAGIRIMQHHWSRFHFVTNWNERWAMSLAAYNCGLTRTLRSLRLGRGWQRGIPGETRQYIVKVMRRYYGR